MNIDEMTEAIEKAEREVKRGDYVTEKMVKIIVGRLRSAKVGSYYLKRLKKELKDFNMHTGRWKD